MSNWKPTMRSPRYLILSAALLAGCGDGAPEEAPLSGAGGTTTEVIIGDPPEPRAGSAGASALPERLPSANAPPERPEIEPPVGENWTSICVDANGEAMPYDFSRGLSAEYSFELAMSCEVGGFLTPLVDADPVNLSQVDGYVAELTDWYRATVLGCVDDSSTPNPNAFALVPESQVDGMSNGDFEATVALFMSVVDRHDGQPDGLSGQNKAELRRRLKTFKTKAVKKNSDELTRRGPAPECEDTGGTGGAPND